jgi:hypothetical protein
MRSQVNSACAMAGLRCITLAGVMAAALAAPWAALAQGAETGEQAAIRKVMAAEWDRPDARLEVDPVVVAGRYAIAGWTQGDHGGRALLKQDGQRGWHVTVCAGDGLKDARALELAGMPASTAQDLVRALRRAEAAVPQSRLALFSTFSGMVNMDSPQSRSNSK